MNRIFTIQCKILEIIDEYKNEKLNRDYSLDFEKIHMISSAKIAQILAIKRGIDPELSAIACSFHDYGRIITGVQHNHATVGYQPLLELLSKFDNITTQEKEIIALAAKNHSSKNEIGTPIEENVKDADVLDCWQYGLLLEREEQKNRLEKVLLELNL